MQAGHDGRGLRQPRDGLGIHETPTTGQMEAAPKEGAAAVGADSALVNPSPSSSSSSSWLVVARTATNALGCEENPLPLPLHFFFFFFVWHQLQRQTVVVVVVMVAPAYSSHSHLPQRRALVPRLGLGPGGQTAPGSPPSRARRKGPGQPPAEAEVEQGVAETGTSIA